MEESVVVKQFAWEDLGDPNTGRPHLGMEASIIPFRLMQLAIRNTLAHEFGQKRADAIVRRAGHAAGIQFCTHCLDRSGDLNAFTAQLQGVMRDLKVGLLRVERILTDPVRIVLTIAEDLDCSGVPVSHESICVYEEGFIAGILEEYTGLALTVREVDCWASGDRVCRFEVTEHGTA